MKILVTGASGFIGFHLCKKLLQNNYEVIGIDNFNSYYDPSLKEDRFKELKKISSKKYFQIYREDIKNFSSLDKIFRNSQPDIVVNLAAQAGVRYSIENPSEYVQTNLVGFANILECCRIQNVKHFVYASSSSVYGGNTKMPFSENQSVDHPVSLYAATKKSNELMAHSYSHLYNIPATGLRFFTVYGPWGRPDMALFLFTKAILRDQKIKVFNNGKMIRDFTYIDDVAESLLRIIFKPSTPDDSFDTNHPNPNTSWAPHRIYNIGNSNPSSLMDYIRAIENCLGIEAKKEFLPLQMGDVPSTSSNCSELESWIGFRPKTSISDGVRKFVEWYRKFYEI
tara:strand:+ start:2332 stop:3348 length:1017 start_codon:yes stop_codon:yes gene_type:complete